MHSYPGQSHVGVAGTVSARRVDEPSEALSGKTVDRRRDQQAGAWTQHQF